MYYICFLGATKLRFEQDGISRWQLRVGRNGKLIPGVPVKLIDLK